MTTFHDHAGDVRVEQVGSHHLADLDRLFATDAVADRCWCAWFCRPVTEFHAVGRAGNRELFVDTLRRSTSPIGLLAFAGTEPVGWCAVGERSRFGRAVNVPTLARRQGGDDDVWLVPCFFIRREHRGRGVAAALLSAAVVCAEDHGAEAIEGFPFASTKPRPAGPDAMVGTQDLFERRGFVVVDRPSARRVVMRMELPRA